MFAIRVPLLCVLAGAVIGAGYGQDKFGAAAPQLTGQEMETFLRTAKIIKMRSASKGVTNSQRATLSNGKFTHDAHVQFINETKAEFKSDRGTELNFKDTYKFNIAAYKLDQILGLNMIPVSVERKVQGQTAAVTWWVDDIMMDEEQRSKKHMSAPDPDNWNKQMFMVRVFDQLIFNTDRNLGNLLIRNGWKLEMIDHTRAFRIQKVLRNPENLSRCDRSLLTHLKHLDEGTLRQELEPWLTRTEIRALLARRDRIVQFFDERVKEKGETAVLYDLAAAKAAR